MAIAANTTSLLSTAGYAADQFGLDSLLDLPNNSVFMGSGQGFSLVSVSNIGPGASLYLPVMGARTVTARTRGTSDNSDITATAIGDSKKSFTKRFVQDAIVFDQMALNDLDPARLRLHIDDWGAQARMAMGNDVDNTFLSLYSSAANTVGSAAGDFTIDALAEAKKLLRAANAPGPYFAVLPATQDDHLALTDELNRFDIRGNGDTAVNGPVNGIKYRWQGVDIYTTGNCPTASNVAYGLVFSMQGIKAQFRNVPTIEEWREGKEMSTYLNMYMDYIYMNTFNDWIVAFQFQAN